MYFPASTIHPTIARYLIQPLLVLSLVSVPSLTPVISLSLPSRPTRYTIKAADCGHPTDGLSACRAEGETPALPCLEGHSQWWKAPKRHFASTALWSSSRAGHWAQPGAPAACDKHLNGTFTPYRQIFWSCKSPTTNKHRAAPDANPLG